MLLAVYVERINPGEFGVAQPWNYVFKRMCSKQKTISTVTPFASSQSINKIDLTIPTTPNHWIDSDPINGDIAPSISIINLTKKFGKFTAVSDLSLRFYMGEVCTLLGHNGAGKTTITFILVGMSEPTSGTVIVEGYDYRTHSEEIRKMIGFCPQYGKLIDMHPIDTLLFIFRYSLWSIIGRRTFEVDGTGR
jgi:ABC-type glutathione transport system ATPase component